MSQPLALIVEDDDDQADIFATTLQEAKYDTEIAASVEVALTILREQTPALILLDLHLPDASGAELLPYIRREARFERLRVVLATADALLADFVVEKDPGVFTTLLKPVSPAQLYELALRLRPASPATA
jgi:CheY-like chemotaxis protein